MIDVYISDLHLGNPNLDTYKIKTLLQFLQGKPIDHIFLVGDILDTWYDHDFLELLDIYKNFFRDLRHCFYRRGIIVYGNHDVEFSKLSKVNGFDVYESIKYNGFTILHGHQFDPEIIASIEKDKFAVRFYYKIQKLFGKKFSLASKIADNMNLMRIQKRKLMENTKGNIITGHTHIPTIEVYDDRIYINCGDSLQHSTIVYGEANKYFVLYDYMKKEELARITL